MAILNFQLSENLFVRDPQETKLGRDIVQKSVELIDKLGFEGFTFRKLARDIGSTEASVYRYFDNKHLLLIYLIDWYWVWMEHNIDYQVNNIRDPRERLRACLTVLSGQQSLNKITYLDEIALQRIVQAEFEKTYLTKEVDSDNEEGLFLPYKSLCNKITTMVRAVNPRYAFPRALVSTLMLAANHQLFYAEHLPSLTDIRHDPKKQHKKLNIFLEALVFKTIEAS